MRVRDFECRSYDHASTLLGGLNYRKVCLNTALRRNDVINSIWLELHGHRIVEFFEDGDVVLDRCGYPTVTTKDRMNRVLPPEWKIYQTRGVWSLWNYKTKVDRKFHDGVLVR